MSPLRRWLRQQRPGIPVRCSALLRDGVTPHGEAHTHDGAGNEDQENHKGTDQEVQEGVEEGAAMGSRERCWSRHTVPPPEAPLEPEKGVQASW